MFHVPGLFYHTAKPNQENHPSRTMLWKEKLILCLSHLFILLALLCGQFWSAAYLLTFKPSSVCVSVFVYVCALYFTLKTPEKRSHNGYTNLPDVVQPSHSPTDSASHSSPGKDSVYDVSFTDAKYISPEFLVYFYVISVGSRFSCWVTRKIRTLFFVQL